MDLEQSTINRLLKNEIIDMSERLERMEQLLIRLDKRGTSTKRSRSIKQKDRKSSVKAAENLESSSVSAADNNVFEDYL